MANRPETMMIEQGGLGKRKSIFVMITVVGCIAILWPKIISPMFSAPPPHHHPVSDGFGSPGCCGIVMNQGLSNVTLKGDFVRNFKLPASELVFRQERPAHLKEAGIHPAMQERGRAIPPGKGVPAKPPAAKPSKNSFTYRVDGRPGPIPGLRPQPGGAAQQNKRREGSGSSSFLLPAYTIGIVVFFVYTLIKLATKNKDEVPAKALKKNEFKQKVFEAESDLTSKMQYSNKIGWEEHKTKLQDINPIYSCVSKDISEKHAADNEEAIAVSPSTDDDSTESAPLLEIALLKKKLEQTENKMNNIIADMFEDEHQADCKNLPAKKRANDDIAKVQTASPCESNGHDDVESLDSHPKPEPETTHGQNGIGNNECSVKVLGLEVITTSSDISRSFSPIQSQVAEKEPALQSIFLEGSIGHESNILVKDAETKTDEILNDEDDQMVVLSSKMTLSLINVDADSASN